MHSFTVLVPLETKSYTFVCFLLLPHLMTPLAGFLDVICCFTAIFHCKPFLTYSSPWMEFGESIHGNKDFGERSSLLVFKAISRTSN